MSLWRLDISTKRLGAKFDKLVERKATDPARLIKALRGAPIATIRNVLGRCDDNMRARLLGEPTFGRNLETLLVPGPASATKSLEDEIRWLLLGLEPHVAKLATHVAKATETLRAILLSSFDAARGKLASIERDYGTSLWSVSSHLLLAQREGGLNANREMLALYRELAGSVSTRALLEFASQRAETSSNYSSFALDILRSLQSISIEGGYAPILNWWFFNSAPYHQHISSAFDSDIVWRTGLLPAIDRYIAIVNVLHTQSEHDREALVRGKCQGGLRTLAAGMVDADPTLTWMLHCATGSDPYYGPEFVTLNKIVDLYTVGNYASCIEASLERLAFRPEIFEYYELIANSAAFTRASVSDALPSGSLAAEILSSVTSVTRRDSVAGAYERLLRIATTISGHRLGAQIAGFASTIPGSSEDTHVPSSVYLACTELTPRYYLSSGSSRNAEDLELLEASSPDSVTVRLFKAVSSGRCDLIPEVVPKSRRLKYEAATLERSGELIDALTKYQELASGHGETELLLEAAFAGIFRIAARTGNHESAARAVVDAFLHNPTMLAAIDILSFAEMMRSAPGVRKPAILWPLFWTAVDRLAPEAHNRQLICNALEDYVLSLGLAMPSELPATVVNTDDQKYLVPLLWLSATTAVLDHLPDIEDEEQLEQERIKILEALLALSPTDEAQYKAEISHHARNAAVRKLLVVVDHSKIHIDTEGIVDQLGDAFQQRYDRFVQYATLSETIRTLSLAYEQTAPEPHERELYERIRFLAKSGSHFDSALRQCWDLFSELTGKVISGNEYGLDSYLSTRIRHGVLSGQLRSPFAGEQLITQRVSPSEYARNQRWEDWTSGCVKPELATTVERRLREFSRDVDRVIDTFNNERMQIKVKPADRGLFDYVYVFEEDAQPIWRASRTAESYGEYVNGIFRLLFDRTALNLKAIASHVRNELAQQLRSLLDQLTHDLHEISPKLTHGDLGNALRQCGIALQSNIESTASWFAPSAEHAVITVDLEVLGAAVIDAVKQMYPTYEIEIDHQTRSGQLIEGHLLPSIWDAVLILLDNTVRHSKSAKIEGALNFEREEGLLRLEVRNSSTVARADLEEVARRLSMPSSQWKPSGAIRREGGSGFYKLHKTLRYDLRSGLNYEINATVEDGPAGYSFVVRIQCHLP
jgi:hypothetical protein